MALKALKQCTKIRKYAVFGFIRGIGKRLSLPPIPTMIDYVCLSYYSPNTDFFDKLSGDTKVSVDQLTVTCISENDNGWISAFGYQLIESLTLKRHEWIFKIRELNTIRKGGIAFGIERERQDTIINNAFCCRNTNYSAAIYGKTKEIYKCYDGEEEMLNEHDNQYSGDLTGGIKVILWLQNGELTLLINDNIVFDAEEIKKGIDIKYRMAISIDGKSNSVVLERYTES